MRKMKNSLFWISLMLASSCYTDRCMSCSKSFKLQNSKKARNEQFQLMSTMTEYSSNVKDSTLHYIEYAEIDDCIFSFLISDIGVKDTLWICSKGLYNKKGVLLKFDTTLNTPYVIDSKVFGTDVVYLKEITTNDNETNYTFQFELFDTRSKAVTEIVINKNKGILSYNYYDGYSRRKLNLKRN